MTVGVDDANAKFVVILREDGGQPSEDGKTIGETGLCLFQTGKRSVYFGVGGHIWM